MLNHKEENVLVQTLITHIISLNEEIDELEEKLKITMESSRELKDINTRLKLLVNSVHGKTNSPTF